MKTAKPELMCLGCGCTDERACPDGCYWEQPGICSTCVPRSQELLIENAIARDLVVRAAMGSLRRRRRSFRVMSLALVAWHADEKRAERHADHLKEGRSLKPFTTVRIGKTGWSYRLVYSATKGSDAFTWTEGWRLSYPERNRR